MARKILFALAFCAALGSFVFAPPAMAQFTGASSYSGLSAINKIIRATPGISAVSVPGATTATATAVESVALAEAGLTIPVATTAAATVAGSTMSGIAGKIMIGGGLIGAASIILPMIIDKANIYVCPPPQFFCKPDPKGPQPGDLYGSYTARANSGASSCLTLAEHCDYLAAAKASCRGVTVNTNGVPQNPNPFYNAQTNTWAFMFNCSPNFGGGNVTVSTVQPSSCPAGYHLSNGQCVSDSATIPSVQATEADISGPLTTAVNSNASNQKNLYDVLTQNGAQVFTGGTAVTVTAPPVTVPARTTTQDIVNPDGTTSHQVITKETTVTPQVNGTTIDNTTITYPADTKVTTTSTNTTTNVTTTTTIIIHENGQQQPTPDKVNLPTDYARENTLEAIQRNTSPEGAPSMPDQKSVVTAATAKSDADYLNLRTGIETAHTGSDKSSFFSFLWTPPVGTCSASVGTVHGWEVKLDPCDTVNNIRDVLGWLLALFTGWSIWNLMFKGAE
jgi:hypothetical protein